MKYYIKIRIIMIGFLYILTIGLMDQIECMI